MEIWEGTTRMERCHIDPCPQETSKNVGKGGGGKVARRGMEWK